MNARTELQIVAVPGGTTKHGVVLRGLVVPRLSGLDETATAAAYGLADWPDLLSHSTITVHVAQSPEMPTTTVPVTLRPVASSPVWQAMLGGIHVKPFTPPKEYPDPHVLPSAAHVSTVETIYATAGRHAGDPAVIDTQLKTVPDSTLPPAELPATAGTGQPDPDFHKLVTLFREHPAVLRVLGLILEFDVTDPGALTASSPGVIRVELTLPAAAAGFVLATPWTHYEYANKRFLPKPAVGSSIRNGLLDLEGPQWRVATFDVTTTMDRLRLAKSTSERHALPAVRSTGLSLLDGGRERQLRARNRAATANTARRSTDLELWADDLVLGYRVDVRTTASAWMSVCRRKATYGTPGGLAIGPAGAEEEGHVKAHGAAFRGAGRTGQPTDGLVTDETVIRWDGWSMVTPRVAQPSSTERAPARAWLTWRFSPLQVPRLRFGESYLVRLRVTDLAGGGLEPDDPAQSEGASPATFYGRHDPLLPPELAMPPNLAEHPELLGPGGLLDVLVIRSDPWPPPDTAPVGALDADQYAVEHDYPVNNTRMLLPPAAAFALCDQLDALPDTLPDDAYADLLARATTPPAYSDDGEYSWLPDPSAEGVSLTARPGPPLGTPVVPPTVPEGWAVTGGQWPDYAAKHIHLTTPSGGSTKVVEWLDDRNAVVRLNPAETLTVAVSSSVADINPFAMTNWLQNGVGQTSPTDGQDVLDHLMELVRFGRHPLVSPPHELRFVHAVQHPRYAPKGAVTAHREPGQTYARIADAQPGDNPWLGLDAASTGQLDVYAEWPEYDPMGGENPAKTLQQHVGSFTVDPSATALPDLRHEFGDTRHRVVSYRLVAASRFRQYFTGLTDADLSKEATFSVSVPNTATPERPAVLAVAPAFAWRTDTGARLTRVRKALLRVELDRPWNLTGQDERLGVVIQPDGAVQPRTLVTRIRRDPIWATPLPTADPTESMFPRKLQVLSVTPAGSPVPLKVLAHEVHFDDQSPRWYADLEIVQPPAESYNPFVELALVRLQPASLGGCEASAVVRAEAAQLLPLRTLTCWQDAAGLHARLDGTGPIGAHANLVQATLEILPGNLDPATVEVTTLGDGTDGVPAWRRSTSVSGPLGTDLPPITLTSDPADHCRLVIQEIETFAESPAAPNPELADRTVFLDIVRLADIPGGTG